MFDIGFSELFVIAIVALLVLGPERLPRAARFAGLWVRRARAQWHSVRSELENELADEELKRSLRRTQEELRDVRQQLQAGGEQLQRDLERERTRVGQELGRMDPSRSPPHAPSAGDPAAGQSTADCGTGAAADSGAVADFPPSGAFDLASRPPRQALDEGQRTPAEPGNAVSAPQGPFEVDPPRREGDPAHRDAEAANRPPHGPRP